MSDAARILLIEDSETQALQMRMLLEAEGFEVSRVATAEAGLETLAAVRPDLMLVDYHLPGMNGDELVRQVRLNGRTRALPILMLTGGPTRERELQGLESGASAYVPKSSDPALLIGRLRALLRQRAGSDRAPPPVFRRGALLLLTADPAFRRMFESLLTGEGYRLLVVEEVAAARERIAAEPVDGVLVDVGEGDAAGLAALAAVTEMRGPASGFEVIAIGEGRPGGELTMRGFAAGADDVLPRSEDRETQAARIRAVVRRKLARDEEQRSAEHERQREAALARARVEAAGAEALAAANRDLAAANDRLSATQAQLVQAAKMASLGELVAGIAHEINNPLAFLLAHQATVRRLVGDASRESASAAVAAKLDRAAERLDAMKGGLGRIQQLIIKLRRFSRLDEGDRVPTDIPESIDAVLTLLEPKLGRISVHRDYRAAPMLVCSAGLINQVVMNILSNAADALPDGGTIEIATAERGGRYEIAIGDDGPGIPAATRSRVFEPFYTTKEIGVGTGLGLAIAYGVVRSHGGDIRIEEGPRGGALFTVAVPCGMAVS